jgi:hypothetical protein
MLKRGSVAGVGVGLAGLTAAEDASAAQAPAGLRPIPVKTSAYTASPGDFVPVDASKASITIALPTAPADQTQVGVKVIAIGANRVVDVVCRGSDVVNQAGGRTWFSMLDAGQGALLQYEASTHIWYVQANALSLNIADVGSWVSFPEAFGAVGDGQTDDSAALRAWVASGKRLELTPRKTYLCRHALIVSTPGQTISGNGSTIKAPAQLATTTTTSVTAGKTNQITLADASKFVIGDMLVLEQGGVWDEYGNPSTTTITAISGSTVTINGTFGVSFSGTTNVRTGVHQLTVQADNVRVSNLVLDGNSANVPWTRWSSHHGIASFGSANCVVDHNQLLNQCGDALGTGQCKNAVFAFNDVENATARGFSFGSQHLPIADIGNKCIYNRFINCETDPNAHGNDGHGSINFSQGGDYCLIHGNYIETGITGIGNMAAGTRLGMTISDNTIKGCSTAAIEAQCRSTTFDSDVHIHGNTIIDCGPVTITQPRAGATPDTNWVIANNILVNTGILVKNAIWIAITDNQFTSDADDTSGAAITFNVVGSEGVDRSVIRDNQIDGFDIGISVGPSNEVFVSGNQCIGQGSYGIVVTAAVQNLPQNIVVSRNLVRVVSGANGGYRGIQLQAQGTLEDNHVDLSAGGKGMAGIDVNTSAYGARAQILRNRVRVGTSGATPILIRNGSTATILTGNLLDAMYTDTGASTVKRDNQIGPGPVVGSVALSGGKAVVNTPEVRGTDIIRLTRIATGSSAALGELAVSAVAPGSSFTISAVQPSSPQTVEARDQSTVAWEIVH